MTVAAVLPLLQAQPKFFFLWRKRGRPVGRHILLQGTLCDRLLQQAQCMAGDFLLVTRLGSDNVEAKCAEKIEQLSGMWEVSPEFFFAPLQCCCLAGLVGARTKSWVLPKGFGLRSSGTPQLPRTTFGGRVLEFAVAVHYSWSALWFQ